MLILIYGGPASPPQPTGSGACTIIPVAHAGSITPTTNSSGKLTATRLMGYGSVSGAVSVTDGSTFTLESNDEFVAFPMPYDAKITSVIGRYTTTVTWTAPTNMSLYIAVAIAPEGSKTFTILEESRALGTPYTQGVNYPARSLSTGNADGLDIQVKKGDCVAIIAGYHNTGTGLGRSLPFNYTGSIVLEKT